MSLSVERSPGVIHLTKITLPPCYIKKFHKISSYIFLLFHQNAGCISIILLHKKTLYLVLLIDLRLFSKHIVMHFNPYYSFLVCLCCSQICLFVFKILNLKTVCNNYTSIYSYLHDLLCIIVKSEENKNLAPFH